MELALNQNVLVLNRLWQAVNICSARRAFSLLYLGEAQVVDSQSGDYQTFNFKQWHDFSQSHVSSDHEVVHTISFKIRVPKIIVLLMFDRMPKKEVKLTRQNVFDRDQNTCQYCGKTLDRKDLNIDHVVPRDKGGTTTWENVVCSCIPCNTRKSNHLPHEIGMKLLRRPKRPKLRPFLTMQMSKTHHPSWRHFLDVAYWNVELSD
jgi:5-methylcytosine-specific restriction endonuclease McrA